MKNMWDDRFASDEFVYGEKANEFIKEKLESLEPGKALFPAEGEGRNAVFAASKGWDATAYDTSEVGKLKALKWAESEGLSLSYILDGHETFKSDKESFDALILCFAHVPESMRRPLHKRLWDMIKPGGHLILEGFAKEQLGLSSGGPKELSMLFDLEELKLDFESTQWIISESGKTHLNEGPLHQGEASTVRLFGRKD